MFEMFVNLDRVPDSMCFDSYTHICNYKDGNDTIDIMVNGYVTVYFQDYKYRHFTDMPKELQDLFISGKAYRDSRVFIDENNWYEVFFNHDEAYDVAEIEGCSQNELEDYCKECMELYRQ